MNNSVQTQFLKLNGGTIAYDDQGTGPLVLCLPAGGDTRAEYRFTTPTLVAAGYRVVTMDIRGQGETSAVWDDYGYEAMSADVVALLQHLQAGPAVVIGVSKAAGVVALAAVDHPELIRKVVAMGPFMRTKPKLMSKLTANLALAPGYGVPLFMWYTSKMYPVKPVDYAEQTAKVRTMLKEAGRLKALRIMFGDNGANLDAKLAELKQPIMIIMGEKDPDFPKPEVEVAEIVKRLTATSPQTHMIAKVGHHPQTQAPEEVAQLLLNFIA